MKKILFFVLFVGGIATVWFGWRVNHLPSDFIIENLQDGKIHVLGHGGNGFRSSETINSISSFETVISYETGGTEMDVQLTRDDVLIAFHDERLDEKTDCNGAISNLDFKEIQSCSKNGKLASIEEILNLNWKDGTTFSFDLKNYGQDSSYEIRVANKLKELHTNFPQYTLLFESPSVSFLNYLKKAGLSSLFLYCVDSKDGIELCVRNNFSGISIDNKLIDKLQVIQAHKKNLRVMIWGVGNSWNNRDAVLKSPDLIQTDDIQHLQQLLNR